MLTADGTRPLAVLLFLRLTLMIWLDADIAHRLMHDNQWDWAAGELVNVHTMRAKQVLYHKNILIMGLILDMSSKPCR